MLRKRIQLALVHMAVAITLVPINSTLNRVMIHELAISASLVALLASLPYIFSPLQVVIGSFSDRHPIFGYRRTPYIITGLALCVLGVILAPQAVFLIPQNRLPGLILSALVFGAWGMGFNLASVSYLSLASEISGEKGRSRTVSIMWFIMILGIILTAATLSRLLEGYNPQRLKTAFEIVGAAALIIGVIGLIKLEDRSKPLGLSTERSGWQPLLRGVLDNPPARRFFIYLVLLLAAILGQDVLLEPYAGYAFNLPVEATTRITSIWGGCVLAALLIAGWLEGRFNKRIVAQMGAWGAIIGFLVIALSGLVATRSGFYTGVVLLGFGTGLSTVANLSLMLDMTTARVGLYIGAWGMADALARLLGTLLSGVVRDITSFLSGSVLWGYLTVFLIESIMLGVSLLLLRRIDVQQFRQQTSLDLEQRTALMHEAS